MAKIITKGGFCDTKKKPMGFQFALQNDGKYALGGSFGASGDGIVTSDEAVSGDGAILSSYSSHGCRTCGNKYAYVCPACGAVVCCDGKQKSNAACPSCKSVINVAQAVGSAMPKATVVSKTSFTVNKGDASENGPYTKWAGVSVITGAATDAYGNAKGSQYDLAKDGAFKDYTIIVINLCSAYCNAVSPTKALQKKGFTVLDRTNMPNDSELARLLALPDSQLWLISGMNKTISDYAINKIYDYYVQGHGVYVWSDNDPWYADSNALLAKMYGSNVNMFGDYNGDKVLGIQPHTGAPGIIANHPITTGLVNFYEGITISTVNIGNSTLTPLMYNSQSGIVAAYDDKSGRRALIDGGFTRLYHKWDSAGTDRYIVNAAAWLTNIERFGYHKH